MASDLDFGSGLDVSSNEFRVKNNETIGISMFLFLKREDGLVIAVFIVSNRFYKGS